MKKSWLIILGAVIVLVGIGTMAILAGKKDGAKNKTSEDSSSHEHADAGHLGKRDACDYLKQADTDQLLGAGSEKGSLNADASSSDVYVSTCTYTTKAETLEEVRGMRTASLLVRAPLTETGAESNQMPFGNRPEGAQDVTGYGEQAYWDPFMGQLNVLKEDTWLIISNGKTNPGERTLDEARQLADIVVPRV